MAINKTTQYTTDPNTIPVDTSTGTDQPISEAFDARVNQSQVGTDPSQIPTLEDDGSGSGRIPLPLSQISNDFYGSDSQRHYWPSFQKHTGNPIFELSDSAAPSVYWPSVIRVDRYLVSPIDTYYMYYSTDHDGGAGGIYLATAPDPIGPWTDQGLIYQDSVDGDETETPSIIFNEETSEFYLYYHNSGAGIHQSTVLAKSSDGVSFTRFGIVIDISSVTSWPGDGHTGYFRAMRMNNLWYGYHLLGGTDFPHFGISYSIDGEEWMTDPRPLGYSQDVVSSPDNRLEWSTGQVVEYRGRKWWIGFRSTFASGGAGATGVIVTVPVSEDLRNLIGPPRTILEASEAWETTAIRSVSVMQDGGDLYLYYVMDNKIGVANLGVFE